jgi:hypothetical protein
MDASSNNLGIGLVTDLHQIQSVELTYLRR